MGNENILLAALEADVRESISREMELVVMSCRQQVMRRRCRPDYIYFPEGGLVSVIARSARREQADVGTIGREGCTAVEVVLGCERAYQDAIVLVSGPAWRIDTERVLTLCQHGSPLRAVLMRYAYVTLMQARETALVNARGTILQRVARWILIACEKMSTTQLPLTHDEISAALGVRRAGVTVALGRLADTGVIHMERGRIAIDNALGLIEAARGYYSAMGMADPGFVPAGAD
ncbi:Crp/Fnr family transcriptional regulator [Hyphomicrobium sp. D-2]|uniref:Crp/Fnr family transcriptional regulator n=1 Tax=Hyphomicrobium sp. D-2 TaxID=3041621 RepID=UPI0024590FD6|nr:Crp/Fnr family transcriptional regulator [Hyphomicrobium sp. D-2]MDH4981185.1 Crp/Fnr family transcriptional regulator [Hyphomicrobium sp. D-2]